MSFVQSLFGKLRRFSPDYQRPVNDPGLRDQLSKLNLAVAEGLRLSILADPRYQDPRRLTRSGFKVYSQFDEDGILDEIFQRIGTTNRFFVEFGVGDGLENNTLYRLAGGWRGVWLDGSPTCVATIREAYRELIAAGRLNLVEAFIRPDNIQDVFAQAQVPEEFDLLSIDIDGNDYWVWQAIVRYHPRVVVIEYNAGLGPSLSWSVPMVPDRRWDGTRMFGASLKALELLGRSKGYSLVGCGIGGANAFFVRSDLAGDKFLTPTDAGVHFEPPRYYLTMYAGHSPSHREVASILTGLGIPANPKE